MTRPLGTHSFLPWLRQGIANEIQSPDFDTSVRVRASVEVNLAVTGEAVGGGTVQTTPVTRSVELFGPGDIVGIDRRAIVRTEPRDWITNFEPNYLAHIEFYDEDFPWRYTPAAPDLAKGRLRPWIALVVLEEGEFTEGQAPGDRPLPYIEVPDLGVFPRPDELWAWAHVHVNRTLAASDAEFVSTDMSAVIPKLKAVLAENPDLAYSRLMSPRKLGQNRPYHAFLMPTFEAGRRAGLGLDLGDLPATMSAWDASTRPDGQRFPYYYRWFFRTGDTGDFETLVRLLKPNPIDPRVGTREMDVQFPGSNVRGVDNPELGGILKLGGALRPPSKVPPEPPDVFELWDEPFPRPLQEDLARLINLADDYQRMGDPDPIVTPPLYGTWHALANRVLVEADGSPVVPRDNWVQRLNLDPRFRVAAGLGTRVIQDQQELLVDAAWEQVGKVLEAQRRVRFGQFSLEVSQIWYDRHLMPMLDVSRQKMLLLVAPLNKRILAGGVTIHHALGESLVQPAMTSSAFRRAIRPRARLVRSLPFDTTRLPDQLIARVNAAEVSAAPPKVAPPGAITTDRAADLIRPSDAPAAILELLRRLPQLPTLLVVAAIILALLLVLAAPAIGILLGIAIVGGAVVLARKLSQWRDADRAADAVSDAGQTPEAVDRLPQVSNFVISPLGNRFTPQPGPDSIEALRFKSALRDSFTLRQASASAGAVIPLHSLDLGDTALTAITALEPSRTVARRIRAAIFVPPRITEEIGDTFVEPMAYPVIDLPMYEPLKKLSSELFLPNVQLITQNTITLLETNQRFIESYMVGLNHEFARELLWREYPTDLRGSTFRQFWDVRGVFNSENLSDDALKEKLRDIPPLHLWAKDSALGTHNNRDLPDLVLAIRGELLKRYPTAVIYAHRACWQRKSDGSPDDMAKDPCFRSGGIDNTQERRLIPLTPDEEDAPPRSKVRTPLYEAKVDPDIYFLGFDLTVAEVKGGTGEDPNDDPGWFFVIKERPGEPRFGLDEDQQPVLNVWNDLSWPDVLPNPPGSFIEIATAPGAFTLVPPGAGDEKAVQFADDQKIAWSHDMSSSELAYILFQAPVLVAVHASEMLAKL
jgi:hypothetical protein